MLTRDLELAPAVGKAVAAAQDRGVTVTIATGRMHRSAAFYARQLGLGDVPLISYNGALVETVESTRVLRHEPIPLATAVEVARFCEERGYYVQSYVSDEFLYPWFGVASQLYTCVSGFGGKEVGAMSAYLQAHPTYEPSKMLLINDPPVLQAVIPEIRQHLGDRVVVAESYPYFLEVNKGTVSKGRALDWLAQYLGIERGEVLAVGDSYNDLDMLEYAGIGAAIAGAPADVQARANVALRGGSSVGVAEAIERFVLGGEL